jgi:anti-sigma factor ChrR (cupin superfamily)
MSNHPIQNDSDAEALHGIIAEALTPLPLPAVRASSLQQRLMERVAQSAERHRSLRTIRHGDVPWQTLARGVRAQVLYDNGVTRSALVEFAPGSHLPSHRHTAHEECVVLQGSLQAGDCRVGLHDYHLAPAGSLHRSIHSEEGALAFLRGTSIGNSSDMMRELAASLLPGDGAQLTTIVAASEGWREVAPGAFIKVLWHPGASASMLLRMEPGARVPAHEHTVEEECMMLSGEAFFGDILLRAGEYQMAPVTALHDEAYTDVGALLYVHGDEAYLPK